MKRPRLVLVIMCIGYFLVLLDVTVVNVALPDIGRRLGAGVSGLQWVIDGYAVMLAALLLISGSIGDVYGHKRVVLGGLAVFGAASILCGLAPVIAVLVTGRVLQGLGAALVLPGTLAIISDTFPERHAQAKAIGVWAAVGSVALPAGPLIGGLLVQADSWRLVFWLNVPLVLVAGLAIMINVHDHEQPARRRLDWQGAVTGGLFLAVTVLAVIETGRAGVTLATMIMVITAVLLLAGFVVVERTRPDPMLPLGLLRRPSFTTANLVAGAMNFGTLGSLFLLTLYLQSVQHRSPLAAGVALLPAFVPLTVLSPIIGQLTARIGPRIPMTAGLVVAGAGVGLFVRLGPGSPYATLFPALLLWGVGLAVLTPAVVAAAIAAVGPGRSGLASGVNNTARQAAGAAGIAVYGAIAGAPSRAARFVDRVNLLGVVTAALFVAAALASLLLIPRLRAGRVGAAEPVETLP